MSAGGGYMVDVARGDQQFSWSGLAGTMLEGGLDGALSAGVSKFTGGIANKLGMGNLSNRLGITPSRKPGLGSARPPAGRHRAEDSSSPPRSADETGGSSPSSGCSKSRHSFDPSTRVLLADGTTKPIEDVQLGDEVKATDPNTGTSTAKPVTLLHINNDSDLTDVTVQDTASGQKTTLHTTEHHPFWDATDNKWVDAANLAIGHKLRVASDKEQVEGDGSGAGLGGGGPGSTDTDSVTITAVKKVHGTHLMRDLTVADIHTYYVLAGDTPVLVHNCGTGNDPADLRDHTLQDSAASNTNNHAGSVARSQYTGTTAYGESGAVPGNVNPQLVPGLRKAESMVGQPNTPDWDPGTCAEFHSCNNLLNDDPNTRLEDIEYHTVTRADGLPYPSCGWCQIILKGAAER